MRELTRLLFRGLQIKIIFKTLSIAIASLALSITTIAPAQAADLPLNYSQYVASQGYLDMQSAADIHNTKLAAATGLKIDMEMTTNTTGTIRAEIKATKTAATSTVTLLGESITVAYYGNSYFLDLSDAIFELETKNSSLISKRLPSSSVKKIKLSGPPSDGTTLLDMNPSSLFSGSSTSELVDSVLALDTSKFTFSEVTRSANVEDPTSTDYKSQIRMNDTQTGLTLDMTSTSTFNSEGLLTVTLLEQDMSLFGVTVESVTKLTQSIDNSIVLTPPATSTYMTAAKFVALDYQISAELALKTNAGKIVTKAKALAKSAKKPLSGSHIVAAAKALKITSKSVTNGTKISGKYKGVTGNLCITAYKGVASTKNC
ncbi:MAG: hypothetical protein RJA75_492 [Actinomycetota bacterium]|jgi:hypothetical protein